MHRCFRPVAAVFALLALSAGVHGADGLDAESQAAFQVVQKRAAQAVAAGKTVKAEVSYGGVRDKAELVKCEGD